jgi:carboxyl-terminal processing protease
MIQGLTPTPQEGPWFMSRRNLYSLLGLAATSLFAVAVFFFGAPTRAVPVEREEDYKSVKLFVDVLGKVRQNYATELDEERMRKLVEDMINGGLERLDPHSQYINPKEYKQFVKNSKGRFGGIGVQIGFDRQNRGQLTVISPLVGTPAYDAGVLAGDAVIKIDGKPTASMRLSEAVDLIQGDPGQEITLTVLHEGSSDPVDIKIVRDEIKVQNVLGDLRKPGNPKEWDFLLDKQERIGYIRLANFNEEATKEMKAALEELKRQGVRGVILDLRGNPGGLLLAAVDISNFFMADGRIVSTKGRNHKEEVYDAKPAGALLADKAVPLVVLVNRYSASASEIVAGALQDNGRAVIVGERTYGKGSVQNVFKMEKETSALKLTTATYWRPSGKNMHRFPDSKDEDDWGVKPNAGFEVPMKDEERLKYMLWRSERDVVRNKPKEPKPGEKQPEPFTDRVLEKALDYLKAELAKKG